MERSTNALAELAEELEAVYAVAIRGCTEETRVGNVVRKAQRIVAELAKVRDVKHSLGRISPNVFESADAIAKCRAIAEGGES